MPDLPAIILVPHENVCGGVEGDYLRPEVESRLPDAVKERGRANDAAQIGGAKNGILTGKAEQVKVAQVGDNRLGYRQADDELR